MNPGSIWRHYRGGLYRVGSLAWNPEDKQAYVVYSSEKTGQLFVRPLDNWLEKVYTDAGVRASRFTLIED